MTYFVDHVTIPYAWGRVPCPTFWVACQIADDLVEQAVMQGLWCEYIIVPDAQISIEDSYSQA